jgi:hypothetical protein
MPTKLANVAWGHGTTSLVLGTKQGDVVRRANNPHRQAARQALHEPREDRGQRETWNDEGNGGFEGLPQSYVIEFEP